jgi:hypothetical protein
MNYPAKSHGRDLKGGTRSSTTLRELDWTYYDTMALDHTKLQTTMFSVGRSGSTKTLDQTNMKLNALVPTGERMTVNRVKLFLTAVTDLATAKVCKLYEMLKKTTFELRIAGSDSILTLTLQELFGTAFNIAQNVEVAAGVYPNPQIITGGRYHGIYPLNRPVIFAEQETIEVAVTHQVAFDAALDGMLFMVGLNGILERKSS